MVHLGRLLALSRLLLLLLACSCLLLGGGAFTGVAAWPMLPEPFDDRTMVADGQYGDSSQFVEHLGSVAKLNTPISHYGLIKCKFVIETRQQMTEVAFEPSTQCLGDSCAEYQFDLASLSSSGFNASERTIVLIAGFMSDDHVDWFDEIARLWLSLENVNIIKVSWSDGNKFLYSSAVSGVPIVARETTILLHYLIVLAAGREFRGFGAPESAQFARRIQIVGHSLGAHIAGFIGQDLGGRLGRISALDPAGPFFDQQQRQLRLDPTDALLVDAIHTNSGQIHYLNLALGAVSSTFDGVLNRIPLLGGIERSVKDSLGVASAWDEANTGWFGINQQVSHIDYYANNGRVQPGCESGYLHICDHGRAHEIYRDLLEREHKLMTRFGGGGGPASHEVRRQNRALAFRAHDYDEFLVGTSVYDNCASLLEDNRTSPDDDRAIRQCSLPLDLVSPIGELIGELRDTYGLESLSHPERLSPARYYFQTRAQTPLVGDHYLLTVHRSGGSSYWSSQCSLKVSIRMANGLTTELSLLENSTQAFSYDGNPSRFSALFVASNDEPIVRVPLDDEAAPDAGSFLPETISLRISETSSSSVIGAAASKLWSYFSSSSASSVSKCQQTIGQIDVRPLIGSKRTFLGLYGGSSIESTLAADLELVRHLSDIATVNLI